MSSKQQIQINCPYFRMSTIVNNGVHNQVYFCTDMNKPIDALQCCCGDGCRFPNIEKKENSSTENKDEQKEST